MPFDRDILSKVKRLASQKADAMTADHLFTSGQFISYAQSVINSITRADGSNDGSYEKSGR